MPTYALTYRSTDGYYGRLPRQPICNDYMVAMDLANNVDDGTLDHFVQSIHIEHRECGEPMEYCSCEEVQYERGY